MYVSHFVRVALRGALAVACFSASPAYSASNEARLKETFIGALQSTGELYTAMPDQDGDSSVAMVSSPFYHVGACKRVRITFVGNSLDKELNAFPFLKDLLIAPAPSSQACEHLPLDDFFYTRLSSVTPETLLAFIELVQQGRYPYEIDDDEARSCLTEHAHSLTPNMAGQGVGNRADPSKMELSLRGCGFEQDNRQLYLYLDVDDIGAIVGGTAMIAAIGVY